MMLNSRSSVARSTSSSIAITAVAATLLLSACTGVSSAKSQPAISTTATIESSPLSAHFELTSTDTVRGSLASATIVIGNLTGHEIVTSVCGPFVAGLTKMGEPLSLPVLTCAGRYVIPIGEARGREVLDQSQQWVFDRSKSEDSVVWPRWSATPLHWRLRTQGSTGSPRDPGSFPVLIRLVD